MLFYAFFLYMCASSIFVYRPIIKFLNYLYKPIVRPHNSVMYWLYYNTLRRNIIVLYSRYMDLYVNIAIYSYDIILQFIIWITFTYDLLFVLILLKLDHTYFWFRILNTFWYNKNIDYYCKTNGYSYYYLYEFIELRQEC